MIDLHSWPTPNGHKVHIMLEETGLKYSVTPINISAGDQFKPDFLQISPNNKIPAMIDPDGPGGQPISVFETGAILIYLAQKSGQFLPSQEDDPAGYFETLQWLMFQMGGVGPMFGQAHHFNGSARGQVADEKLDYGSERYTNECKRLYGVLDRHLTGKDWVAAGRYTIADIAILPWTRFPENQGVDLDEFPEVKRWRNRLQERPQVKKAYQVLAETRKNLEKDSKSQWDVMFGKTQRSQGK